MAVPRRHRLHPLGPQGNPPRWPTHPGAIPVLRLLIPGPPGTTPLSETPWPRGAKLYYPSTGSFILQTHFFPLSTPPTPKNILPKRHLHRPRLTHAPAPRERPGKQIPIPRKTCITKNIHCCYFLKSLEVTYLLSMRDILWDWELALALQQSEAVQFARITMLSLREIIAKRPALLAQKTLSFFRILSLGLGIVSSVKE